jgi:tetratricopeptide (TPR) repeat protein
MKLCKSGNVFLLFACLPLALAVGPTPDPEVLIEQQHYKQASKILDERLSRNPKDLKSIELLAKIKLEGQQNDDVIKMMEQVLPQNRNNAEFRIIIADAYGQKAQRDGAGTFERMRYARSMKREGDTALALDPRNLDALEGMMLFHLEAPGIVGGDKKKAHEYADRMVAIDPVRGNLDEARIAFAEKHEEILESLYQKALTANPRSYKALIAVGAFYAGDRHRDYEKSDKYLRQAIQVDPDRSGAYTVLAQTLAVREKWPELDQLLAGAEKNVPEDFSYYYQAARVLLNTGKDNARADRYFRKYLTQEPEVGRPTWGHAHWLLGLVLERQGRRDEARQEIQTALKLNPDLKAAEKDLKRIKS